MKTSTRNIPGVKGAGAWGWQPHHLEPFGPHGVFYGTPLLSCIVTHYIFYVACRSNFADVAHTARQIALYLTSAELWGCLSQPQCFLIVKLCLNIFLFTSCQTDFQPEFCNSLTLYKWSVFYLTNASDSPGSLRNGLFNSIFSIGDKSGKCLWKIL